MTTPAAFRGFFLAGFVFWYSSGIFKAMDSHYGSEFGKYLRQQLRQNAHMRKDVEREGAEMRRKLESIGKLPARKAWADVDIAEDAGDPQRPLAAQVAELANSAAVVNVNAAPGQAAQTNTGYSLHREDSSCVRRRTDSEEMVLPLPAEARRQEPAGDWTGCRWDRLEGQDGDIPGQVLRGRCRYDVQVWGQCPACAAAPCNSSLHWTDIIG